MKKILVVVDMQNDFIDGSLGTPEARAIVPNVCRKIREGEWDFIFTTHDVHHNGYLNTQEGKRLPVEHCIAGTDGYLYNDEVGKAFEDYEEKHDELIVDLMKDTFASCRLPKEITRAVITKYEFATEGELEFHLVGVFTDICVISNALLLKTYFPEARIVVDASCCAGSTPEKHLMALEVMRSCQIDILND